MDTYLPNQIRWQAEFLADDLVDDLVGDLDIDSALEEISGLSQTIEGVALVAGQAPDIIERERSAALAALHQERLETMDSLEELLVGIQYYVTHERLETQGSLSRERAEIVCELRLERLEVLAALLAERKALVVELEEERALILETIEALTDKVLAESTIQARELVDHLVWRLAQAVAALLVIGLLGGLLLFRSSRPRA